MAGVILGGCRCIQARQVKRQEDLIQFTISRLRAGHLPHQITSGVNSRKYNRYISPTSSQCSCLDQAGQRASGFELKSRPLAQQGRLWPNCWLIWDPSRSSGMVGEIHPGTCQQLRFQWQANLVPLSVPIWDYSVIRYRGWLPDIENESKWPIGSGETAPVPPSSVLQMSSPVLAWPWSPSLGLRL